MIGREYSSVIARIKERETFGDVVCDFIIVSLDLDVSLMHLENIVTHLSRSTRKLKQGEFS